MQRRDFLKSTAAALPLSGVLHVDAASGETANTELFDKQSEWVRIPFASMNGFGLVSAFEIRWLVCGVCVHKALVTSKVCRHYAREDDVTESLPEDALRAVMQDAAAEARAWCRQMQEHQDEPGGSWAMNWNCVAVDLSGCSLTPSDVLMLRGSD